MIDYIGLARRSDARGVEGLGRIERAVAGVLTDTDSALHIWGVGAESSRAPGFDNSAASFGCITGDDAGRGASQGARVDATLLVLVYESTRNIASRSGGSDAVMQVQVFGVVDLEFIRVVMSLFRVQPVCAEFGRFL